MRIKKKVKRKIEYCEKESISFDSKIPIKMSSKRLYQIISFDMWVRETINDVNRR